MLPRLWEERQWLVSWFLVFWSCFISRLLFACVCHVCEQREHYSSSFRWGCLVVPRSFPTACLFVFVFLLLFICLAATCLQVGTQDLLLRCTDSLAASRGPSRQSQCAGLDCSARVWDLSSPTRGQTHVPYITRWILTSWTTTEVPITTL